MDEGEKVLLSDEEAGWANSIRAIDAHIASLRDKQEQRASWVFKSAGLLAASQPSTQADDEQAEIEKLLKERAMLVAKLRRAVKR